MNNTLRISLFTIVLSLALAGRAASLNWVTVETAAAAGDAAPGLASVENYAGYYLSATMADEIFGSAAPATVADYLAANFETGRDSVAANGTALKSGTYGLGQYSFTEYSASAVAGGDYLAILFYERGDAREFRVFGVDSSKSYDTSVVFDDSTAPAGSVGAWTTAGGIPEPTSGLLLILGVAGLALRRVRRET